MRYTQRITLLYVHDAPDEEEAEAEVNELAEKIGKVMNDETKLEILFAGKTYSDGGQLYDYVAAESEAEGCKVISLFPKTGT